ncbi:MAG: prepilin-type N-terminal cleavage/methylation domain-containing protein [Tepidisphaeraceae bacterium]
MHPAKERSRRVNASAFTLVELLVVIGIIALLVSILVPALGRSRVEAQRVVCMARLRQVGNGFLMYANAHKQVMAYATVYADRLGVGRRYYWCGNSKWIRTTESDYKLDATLLTPYLGKNADIHVSDCPAMIAAGAQNESPDVPSGYNPAYGGAYWLSVADNSGNSFVKLVRIQKPTETVLLADTGALTELGLTRWNWMMEPRYNNTASYTIPRFHGRHGGRGNVLWFDGHVTSETPVYPNTNGLMGGGVGAITYNPEIYRKANLGYLAPAKTPLDDVDINYYFFANKSGRTLTTPK